MLLRATERSEGASFLIRTSYVFAQGTWVLEGAHIPMVVCLPVRPGHEVLCRFRCAGVVTQDCRYTGTPQTQHVTEHTAQQVLQCAAA